jgi:hypothetical protein
VLVGVRASEARDVGAEDVDAVPVEVAPSWVVVLRSSRVGVAGKDLRVAQRDAGVGRW